MAFSTQRGRPRNALPHIDVGTPELRLKHALRLTAEPIDLSLEKKLITAEQHWCGLHLRWLYTLRYGAPNLTTYYTDRAQSGSPAIDDPLWRAQREREYMEASHRLKSSRYYERVMRLCVHNELPAFLSPALTARAKTNPALARELIHTHTQLRNGLDVLALLWRRR